MYIYTHVYTHIYIYIMYIYTHIHIPNKLFPGPGYHCFKDGIV